MSRPLVRLVARTEPVIGEAEAKSGSPFVVTPDEFVAFVARVSNPSNQANKKTAPKLLRYLREHQHWSPFEMAHAVIEINTTRDIARQILRHRSFSFQEFSQRYSSEIEFAEPREARLQDPANRQNSIEIGKDDSSDASVNYLRGRWPAMQSEVMRVAQEAYSTAIAAGIAKEVARSVLPEGLTLSRLYVAGSLRSWIHYIDLRTGNGTQKEHRLIAEECRTVLAGAFPGIFASEVAV